MSRVIIAGSINMDVVAKAARHPLPGETILGTELSYIPGGKGANQAVASARLGVETMLVGCVGSDGFGTTLCSFLRQAGVNISQVRSIERTATGVALIVVAESGENTIVMVPGANHCLTEADVLSVNCAADDILVAQFEIPLPTIEAFFRFGRLRGTRNILNPAPAQVISQELLALSDIVVLNETELQLVSSTPLSLESAVDCCRKLRAFDEQVVVLTLGKEGVVAINGTAVIRELGIPVNAIDTTGAGDCFVGALASRLALGLSIAEAIAFANKAAAISVQRFGAGTSMPSLREVEEV